MVMSQRLTADFADYAAYHRSAGNRRCHAVGIPMIAVALLGMLARLRASDALLRFDGGLVLIVLATTFYLTRDRRLPLPFALVTVGLYFTGRAIPMPGLVALFVVGWIFQLLGHSRFERNRPALLDNAWHLLIGPIWIFAELMGHEPREIPAEALSPRSR